LSCSSEGFGCALDDCDEVALLLQAPQIGFSRLRFIVDE